MPTANEHFNYGLYLHKEGRMEDAIQAFCHAITEDPLYTNAYNNLGVIFHQTGQLPQAEACFRKAIELNPAGVAQYNNLALVFLDMVRLEEAEGCVRAGLEIDPQLPALYNTLGLIYDWLNQDNQTEAAYRKALEIDPLHVDAHYNLGLFFKNRGFDEKAKAEFFKALQIDPQHHPTRLAWATLLLRQGKFTEGWELYDQTRFLYRKNREGQVPFWQGENLKEKSILLFFDQGYGDTLQFVRYIEEIKMLGAQITVWVQRPIVRLVEFSYPGVQIYRKDTPPEKGEFDYACAFMNLPNLLKTTMATIPAYEHYFSLPENLVETWKQKLFCQMTAGRKKKIGFLWAGNPRPYDDNSRSMPFSVWENFWKNSRISQQILWVSLQAGKKAAELENVKGQIIDASADFADFAETGALIQNLDLVISIDSAVAHLSGGLGKETWLLLPWIPEWRWQLERQDTPWYPKMRLFRQTEKNNWEQVMQQVETELERWIEG